MQRVVVAENFMNRGIGSQMMIFCEKVALERGFRILYCHARDTAVNFYLRNHYQTEGDYSLEDGIPHIKMKKEF